MQDLGFVKARNAWCAKKDGVDYRTFVARHVDTVVRMLEAGGLAADAASIEAYRSFAWEGGELAFGGEYPQAPAQRRVVRTRATAARRCCA